MQARVSTHCTQTTATSNHAHISSSVEFMVETSKAASVKQVKSPHTAARCCCTELCSMGPPCVSDVPAKNADCRVLHENSAQFIITVQSPLR